MQCVVAAVNVVCRRRSETVGSSGLRGVMATAAAAATEHYCWRIRLQSIRRRGNRLNRAQRGALGTFFRRRRLRRRVIYSSCRDFPVPCARVESENDFRRPVLRCVWATYCNNNIMTVVFDLFIFLNVGGGWAGLVGVHPDVRARL